MGDGSRSIIKSLRHEWALFLEAFQGDEEVAKKENNTSSDITDLADMEQIRQATKILLEDRKRLNQRLESLSKELDLNTAKLDSLRLIGAGDRDTLQRIMELHDLGQGITMALSKLDEKLRLIRAHESNLNEGMLA